MKNIFVILFVLCSSQFVYSQSGWFELSSGNSYWLLNVKLVNANTGYVGTDHSDLMKTTNSGINWTVYEYGLISGWFNSSFFTNGDTGYLGSDDGKLYKTTNGGLNIFELPTGVNDAIHALYFPTHDTGYAATKYGGVLKTTNSGFNWVILLDPMRNLRFEGIFFSNNQIGYASGESRTQGGMVLRTLNGGATWDSTFIDSTTIAPSSFFTNSQTGYAVGYAYNGTYYNGYIYKTTNSGNNWFKQLSDSSSRYRCVFFVNENTGYVVGWDGGNIPKTTNGGNNWTLYRSYLYWGLHSVYFVDANTGYAVGLNGRILKTTTGGEPIGIKPISNSIPSKFILYQNYPNPFNPTTKIKFDVPLSPLYERGVGGFITLKIYDLLGREVATLVNQQLIPGTYEVEWPAPSGDGTNYPSGVYFYKLTSGDFYSTKKMVLVK